MRIFLGFFLFMACTPKPAPTPDAGTPVTFCDSWLPSENIATIEVDGLSEASGLAASRAQPGVLFTHNDSGNDPELFAVDVTGKWLGTWTIDGVENDDWEDVAVGPCGPTDPTECVFLADIGDNFAMRDTLRVIVVEAPKVPEKPAFSHVAPQRMVTFRYPDGARDAETLLVDPKTGHVYVVAKRPVPEVEVRGVYAIREGPDSQAIVTAERIGNVVPAPGGDGLFTGGSVHPTGRRVVLRTYTTMQEYVIPEGLDFEAFPTLTPHVLDDSGVSEPQGEAVTYDASGRAILTTSEGKSPPLNRRLCAE